MGAPSRLLADAVSSKLVLHSLQTYGLEGNVPDLKGHVVLMDFWASWCGPCAQSFPSLEAIHREFRDRGVIVLGVNVDEERELMDRFLEKHAVTFPVVRDASQKLVAEVNAEAMPTSLLIDASGRIRFRHSGFHGEKTVEALRAQLNSLLGAP